MNITAPTLAIILGAPHAPGQSEKLRAEQWEKPISKALEQFEINTPYRAAAFLAQIIHESAHLNAVVENLNYSAKALVAVFHTRFPDMETAQPYDRNPEKIANYIYGGRMGNTAPGDGWKYRGRSLIQITGKNNYTACGAALKLDLIAHPELLETPDCAALAAGWFWSTHGLNAMADAGDTVGITKRINGGTNGIEERTRLYGAALSALTS